MQTSCLIRIYLKNKTYHRLPKSESLWYEKTVITPHSIFNMREASVIMAYPL